MFAKHIDYRWFRRFKILTMDKIIRLGPNNFDAPSLKSGLVPAISMQHTLRICTTSENNCLGEQ